MNYISTTRAAETRALSGCSGCGATATGDMLSENEKKLVVVGVFGMIGWFFFGGKIKKALK